MKKLAILTLFCALAIGAAAEAQPPAPQDAPAWNRPAIRPYQQRDKQPGPGQMDQQPLPGQMGRQAAPAPADAPDSYAVLARLHQALNGRLAELNAQLDSDNPDKGRIEVLSREIGEIRGKILGAEIDARNRGYRQAPPPDFGAPEPRPRAWHRDPGTWRGDAPAFRGHGHGYHHGGWYCPGMMGNMRGGW